MAYLVFWILVAVLSAFGQRYKIARILLFIVAVCFLGLRYDVGTDYQNYERIFYYGDIFFLEPGNQLLYYIATLFHGDETKILFFLYSFLTYLFLFLTFQNKKFNYSLTACLVIIFTLTFLANGIRQALAISIFLFSYRYIEERKLLKYTILTILAVLFHTSLIIVWPLYFIVNHSFKIQYYVALYLLSIILSQVGIDQLLRPFMHILEIIPEYSNHVENNAEGYLSFGILFRVLIYFVLFLLLLKHKYHEREPILFNMYYLSILLFNIRIGSYIVNRVVVIFDFYQYFLLPILLLDKSCKGKYRQLYIFFFVLAYSSLLIQSIFFDERNHMLPYKTILYLNQ